MTLSTNRADFSHLSLLLSVFENSSEIDSIFCVSGSHWDKVRGLSAEEIRDENIQIDVKIRILFDWVSNAQLMKNIISFQKRLRTIVKSNHIDAIIVLGDRIEMLAVINVCLIDGIKLIHISGGETTKGAIDDKVRNLLSHTADLVFTSGEFFRNHLISQGLNEHKIINAGDPMLEIIDNLNIPEIDELNSKFKLNMKESEFVLCTYHPETDGEDDIKKQFAGLNELLQKSSQDILITSPNADKGGDYILNSIQKAAKLNNRIHFIPHMGFKYYLSAMKFCKYVCGNSSSLIIEAPYMLKGSLLIGHRQEGRPLAQSIVQSGYSYPSLIAAETELKSMVFEKNKMYYERKDTSMIILESLIQYSKNLTLQ